MNRATAPREFQAAPKDLRNAACACMLLTDPERSCSKRATDA